MRRISERVVAQGDVAEQALAIGGTARHGTIEGVEVDFRHPDLTDEWEAAPWWYVWAAGPSHAGVIFPNEAQFTVEYLRKKKSGVADLPAIFVRAGDKLSIHTVVPVIGDRRFDHTHDAQERLAYLRITRGDGAVEDLEKPLSFYGNTRIRQWGTREAFDHIVGRICMALGVGDLHNENLPSFWTWDDPLTNVAAILAHEARDAYFDLLSKLPEDGARGANLERAHLRAVINNAALAGFLLAKAEGEKAEKVAAPILSALDKGREGRLRTDMIERAKEAWAKNPRWTKNHVAEVVRGTSSLRSAIRTIGPYVPTTRHRTPTMKGRHDRAT